PLWGAVDRIDDRHRLLDLGTFYVVESESCLVGGLVELVFTDVVGPPDFDQPLFEIDRHGGLVGDGPGEIVNVDVWAEHLASVAVRERDRRASEGNEYGIGQRVPDVAGVAVEIVIVAAVRLVDNDDDVAAVGEQRVVEAR